MSAVALLHDEALLERARAGTLGAADRARLEAHCRLCGACAMELRWIEDGLHENEPQPDDVATGLRAVEALLGDGSVMAETDGARAEAGAEPAGPSGPPVERQRGGIARRALSNAAVATALFLASASALAAVWTGAAGLPQWLRPAAEPTKEAATTEQPATPRRSRRGSPVSAPAEDDSPEAQATPVEPAVVPPAEPSPAAAPRGERDAELAEGLGPAARHRPARSGEDREARAQGLLRKASAARRRRAYESALALYDRLEDRFGDTAAGQIAVLSRANLLRRRLERPAQALRAYARYIAAPSTPPLLEEARVGRALSARSLGQADVERQAWRDVLRHHPGSLHAPMARSRLAELQAGDAAYTE